MKRKPLSVLLLTVAFIGAIVFSLYPRSGPVLKLEVEKVSTFSIPEKTRGITVKAGESLSIYAAQFKEPWVTSLYLAKLNQKNYPSLKDNPHLLRKGWRILLPVL